MTEKRLLPLEPTPTQLMAVYQWVESYVGSVDPHGQAEGVSIDPETGLMIIKRDGATFPVPLGAEVLLTDDGNFHAVREGAQLFESKIVVIEAERFRGGPTRALEIISWADDLGGEIGYSEPVAEEHAQNGEIKRRADSEHLLVQTLEGIMRADVGDWIIRGLEGEFYPCKPSVFERKYKRVEFDEVVKDAWE